jgi:4-amino-4-deoxy-L-arabinose transferase-like glycosyltransferase
MTFTLTSKHFILALIIIIGVFFRFYQLDQIPPALNWDEVSLGYNAYSILKTGKDEWGQSFPLIFRAYGDFKLPLYVYATVPSIFVFGLNPISTKLVSLLAGIFLIPLTYLIISQLFHSSRLGYIGAALIAFSPWSIHLSRIALEANLFLFLFLLSLYFLIHYRFTWSALSYVLCLFTYNSSRVLFLFFLLIYFSTFLRSKYSLKQLIPGLVTIAFGALLVAYQLFFSQTGQARYYWVSLLDQGAINWINQTRSTFPIPALSRLAINKFTYFSFHFFQNYLSHFDPRYLFIQGGSHYQFNIPGQPLIYPWLLPLALIGLVGLIKSSFASTASSLRFFLFWLLVSPIPSAITRDAPHTLRSITFLLFFTYTITYGIYYLFNWWQFQFKPLLLAGITLTFCLLLFASTLIFWPRYHQYAITYSQSWQYGHQPMVSYLKNHYREYDQILITKKYGEPHEFLLFYWPWPPLSYQTDPAKIWDYHASWYWVDAFDKFKFINDWEIVDQTKNLTGKTLLITSPANFSTDGSKIIQTIHFPDNTIAFQIIAYEK